MALMPPFQSILSQAKRGEPEALTYLYSTYQPTISRYVSRYVPLQVADDITSDIFLKMVTDIPYMRANDETSFRAWLFAIMYTAIAGYHRGPGRACILPLETASNISSPDDPTQPLLQAEKITALTGALSMLTTKHRRVVIGRVVEGKPARALAQQLGKSEAAIYHDQYRALAKLRKDKSLKQWIIRIILMFIAGGAFLFAGIAVVGNAGPGNPLYPVKIWAMPAGDSGVGNRRDTFPRVPVFTPTITPTPTVTPTASPTPIPITRPYQAPSGTKGSILNAVATTLPVTSSDGTPITCVLDACVTLP